MGKRFGKIALKQKKQMNKKYEIISNCSGRRVLVLKSLVNIDMSADIGADDFDAVFIDASDVNYNETRSLLDVSSPISSWKCRLKPRFMSVFNSNDLGRLSPLIDGFASNPLEDSVTVRIEEIYRLMAHYGFAARKGPILDSEQFFQCVCKYCIIRNVLTLSSSTIPTFADGLASVYAAFVEINETVGCGKNPDDKILRNFVSGMMREGMIESDKFIEKIHLCPHCDSDHILFSETCPSCASSNLDEEDMVHHFRCANISPLSEYDEDGELRCPKCIKQFRHIGLDYDKPAKVSVCRNCGSHHLNTDMRATCGACGRKMSPHDLVSYDIMEYRFTPKAFAYLRNTTG